MTADKRLLAVLAHPDDESFGLGGTLALYAQQGVDVHVAIATDGIAGSVVDEYADKREDLAAIRAEELRGAVDVLGAHLHSLGYRDSGYLGDPANDHPEAFINIDLEEGARRVVELIRIVRPQVVITHDETGGYFHPDHIHCYEITRAAFYKAGDADYAPGLGGAPYQPARLYYTVFPSRWVKFFLFMLRLRGQDPTKMGRNNDVDFTKIGRPMKDITTRISIADTWATKQEASAHHRSQGGGGAVSWFPGWLQKRLFGVEYYLRAFPPYEGRNHERDFFAGLVLDDG